MTTHHDTMTWLHLAAAKSLQSCPTLCDPIDGSPPGSMGFARQEYRSAEKAMAPHSSTLAWKIQWMEEPGRLRFMGSLRVRHDWATSLSLFTFMHWRSKMATDSSVSCLENPRDGGAWWAAVYGVAQSRTQLKWLSSSSSSTGGGCHCLLQITP